MPSRAYTGVDLINYLLTDNIIEYPSGGAADHVIVEPSNGRFVCTFTGLETPPTASLNGVAFGGNLLVIGDFDFDQVPAIPNSAIINSIRVKVEFSVNILAMASNIDGGVAASADIQMSVKSLPVDFTYDDLTLLISEYSDVASANALGAVTFSLQQTIPLNITKAQLVADYSQIELGAYNLGFATNGGPSGNGTTSIDGHVTLDNFQFLITYDEATPDITITPSTGPVEGGQSIVVTSPTIDVAELEYAALIGDNVVPLKPKITPEGVILEVPIPSDPACLDCFADCPECESCLDVCANDLESQACQECLETCLDCLTECTASPEFAEACFESTTEPPEETEIIIICGSPGHQFEGSVTLATFTILNFEGSGIYTLVPGKTNDTLYSSTRNGTTYDVKIPNPFGKTGFFRS